MNAAKEFPYFSLNVILREPILGGTQQFTYKNLTAEKVKQYREEMFIIGIRFEHTVRSWEIIHPNNIKSVLITGQESKF